MRHLKSLSKPVSLASTGITGYIEQKVTALNTMIQQKAGSLG
jgi:hypothetical protein